MSSKRSFSVLSYVILALLFAIGLCAYLEESESSPALNIIGYVLSFGFFIAGYKWLCIVLHHCFKFFHLNVQGFRLFSDTETSAKRRFDVLSYVMLSLLFFLGLCAYLEESESSPVVEISAYVLCFGFFIAGFKWLCIFLSRCFRMCRNWFNPQSQEVPPITSEQTQQSWTNKRPASPPPFPAGKLFISYSRADWQQARVICTLLEELNIPYWIDIQNVYSGQNYKKMIVQEIHQCDGVIFLSSQNSNTSPNVCKEISCASDEKKFIIPLKLDDTPYADEIRYDLSSVDYIDYAKDSRNGFPKLRKAILANLAKLRKQGK